MIAAVTGAKGFIGANLVARLEREPGVVVQCLDWPHSDEDLATALASAETVYHLAGINRPREEAEFRLGNVQSTAKVCRCLSGHQGSVRFVLASSAQAILDNPYGNSKREAEEVAAGYARSSGSKVVIYRLKNVFGKWCRPDYNSVVATFCHHIARDEPIRITDPGIELELIYIDDVVSHFMQELSTDSTGGVEYREITPTYRVTLGALAETIQSFRQSRSTLVVPNFGDPWTSRLYATYVSHLPMNELAYGLAQKADARGALAEFAKSDTFGQIFVSRTRPGASRGGHYHQTKAEKFLILQGEAIVRFRHAMSSETIEYRVQGEEFQVLDIPPGCIHSIENVGTSDLVTLFWASEKFDPSRSDTYAPLTPEEKQ